MAVDDGIYREVDQELEEEKQLRQLKQALPWLIVMALIAIAVVAGRQVWDARQQAAKAANAEAFAGAIADETPEALIADLSALRADAPAGYAAMAAFRISAAEDARGNADAAIAALADVIADDSLPQRLRDLARVRAGYAGLSISDDMALRQINGLQEADTPLAMHAKEIAGLAALRAENYDQALRYFSEIESNMAAAASLKQRAEQFAALARVGQSGGSLSSQTLGDSLQQLLDLPAVPAAGDAEAAVPAAESAPEDAGDDTAPAVPAADVVPEQNDTEEGGTSGD